MSTAGTLQYSTRPTLQPLVWAFAISLATHLTLYGVYEVGKHYHWWQRDLMPAWLRKVTELLTPRQPPKNLTAAQKQQQLPMLFVEVDPNMASPDAPAHATHYSSHNTKAANPDPTVDTEIPKIAGTQTHVPKTENTPRSKAMPLQPSPPKPVTKEDTTEAKPKGGQKPGDLAMAKPKPANDPKENSDASVETHTRPRTLAEALSQQPMTISGEMMKQDGSVKRRLEHSLEDTIGTPFGAYNAEIIGAIKSRWDALLEQQTFARDRTGRVVLEFRLNYDGRITDMKVVETTVDDILTYLCQRAITDPAPYRPWPMEMHRLMEADYREVRFTFFYD